MEPKAPAGFLNSAMGNKRGRKGVLRTRVLGGTASMIEIAGTGPAMTVPS
jgi:hypothetical protein